MSEAQMRKFHAPEFKAKEVLEAVQTLIEQGADLEFRDDCGRTPLHAIFTRMQIGAGKWYPEEIACAKALLSAGADPKALDKWGHDVMHYAVSRHCSGIVRILLEEVACMTRLA